MHLYEIDQALQARMEEAERYASEHEGEFPEELDMLISGLEMARDGKIGNLVRYIKNLNAEADMVEIESAKLAKRARICENKANRLKDYLKLFVGEGVKWQDETSKISWRSSEKVEILDQSQIPTKYIKVSTSESVDKAEIKKSIKGGEDIPGATLTSNMNLQLK